MNLREMTPDMARNSRKSSKCGVSYPVKNFDAEVRVIAEAPLGWGEFAQSQCCKPLKGLSLPAVLRLALTQIPSHHFVQINEY